MSVVSKPKHFLDISELPAGELRKILDGASLLKKRREAQRGKSGPLSGRTLAMIFEQPSTRTRISFDVGARELGGEPLMLTGKEMQLGRGESIPDTARVLSRFVDMIMIRMLDHEAVRELAQYSDIPVINGLTKESHPCQIMADIMTFEEHRGPIQGKRIAWVGDSNNVLYSWMQASAKLDFELVVGAPKELTVPQEWLEAVKRQGGNVTITEDPIEAVSGCHAVITDCWVSMGDEDASYRYNLLSPYQVNDNLMAKAHNEAIFMHCLPAHRGEEVTDAVMDGPQSVVFDEAENRLHAQKGIMAWCLDALPEE
ncbi:ornithine carbamoyltransferase [Flexibacterium corallicola]|uniref:ornithine carbamoyltransferase n=1 Tax=Flexibacterium corallicola TaxID=3037259 RepID=UPI00286F6277|nr:ornithine carbamoyltransferase [Pseudovibrio sp. M1P-2-3]